MVEIVSEYVVRDGARGQFELAFGPGGAWGRLFGRCPGFRGITVLRDTEDLRRYLVVELWDAAAQREQALAEQNDEYASLDQRLADWVESRTKLGTFRVLAEATVRSRAKGRVRDAAARRRRDR